MKPDAFQIRRATDRGHFANDWLEARFSFSFGSWHDPRWPRFGPLLAINEDRVQPERGFAMHPHDNLEILMLPRRGRIEHRDNFGGHAVIAPGELLFMRAGTGIRHSQMNPSVDEIDHHFQIWLAPRTAGLRRCSSRHRARAGGWCSPRVPAKAACPSTPTPPRGGAAPSRARHSLCQRDLALTATCT
jgi:redox-sensitive bicupin YhaK (pirin superfamily)